jgi:hypothetical protein
MFKLIQYHATLSDGGTRTDASTKIVASDDSQAKQIALEWVSQLDQRCKGAYLLLTTGNRNVTALGPGEF